MRRVSADMPGWSRRRRGKGFEYRDQYGELLNDAERQRCIELVIPPAWQQVWICPLPNGHLQATGIDDFGRRQYLYHPVWREKREREKFDHTLDVARNFPRARNRVRRDLDLRGVPRERALAVAFCLLDFGLFRIGSPRYEQLHGSTGLSTMLVEQVSFTKEGARFKFVGKSHVDQEVYVQNAALERALRALKRGRAAGDRLLHYRSNGSQDQCHDVDAQQINDYIRDSVGQEATAKDFRTWHATVFAASALALHHPTSRSKREAIVRDVVKKTAHLLGNTPAVAKSSYIDPRIIDEFLHGNSVRLGQNVMPAGPPFPPRIEAAVLGFLS